MRDHFTLICRVIVVKEPVHASFSPHQYDVFRAAKRFPQLLIKRPLQQRIRPLARANIQLLGANLAEIVHVQKQFKAHGLEANFEQLGKVGTAFSAVRYENIARWSLRVGVLSSRSQMIAAAKFQQ